MTTFPSWRSYWDFRWAVSRQLRFVRNHEVERFLDAVLATAEVRPWIGSYVSVAQFKVLRPLRIIDCARGHNSQPHFFEEPDPEERMKAVWVHIDRAFAEPMTRSDDSADYVPTQIIAELFKREGFDGVGYKSNFGDDGFNLALFDLDAAEPINCGLYRVDRVQLDSSEQDNPYFVRKPSAASD